MEANASSAPYPIGTTTTRTRRVLSRVGKTLMILGGIWFCWVFALFGLAFFRVVSSHDAFGISPSAVRASNTGSESDSDLRRAFEEGKLALPDRQLGQTVEAPRLEMFALDLSQGHYPMGALVRLSDLYLTEFPKQSDEVWHLTSGDLLGSGKKFVNLNDAPIIMTNAMARHLMEATPEMGENISPGFQRIYSISDMLGVVQPNPCAAHCLGVLWSRHRQVLLLKEITIGTRKILDDGWGRWQR